MQAFCDKHAEKIHGVLSCFDRMLFQGYLPIMSGAAMAQFLQSEQIDCTDVNTPPAKAGGFGLRLKAGLVGHSADYTT